MTFESCHNKFTYIKDNLRVYSNFWYCINFNICCNLYCYSVMFLLVVRTCLADHSSRAWCIFRVLCLSVIISCVSCLVCVSNRVQYFITCYS